MSRLRVLLLAGAVALTCAPVASADIIEFNFNLSGAQEVPPNNSNAAGSAQLLFDTDTQMFDLDLMVFGIGMADLLNLGPNSTPVHVHEAPMGANGGIIVDLGWFASFMPDGQGIRLQIQGELFGGVQGNLNTDPIANQAALLAGNTYINIHTNAYPGGQIRGQIIPAPGALALLGLAGLVCRRRRR